MTAITARASFLGAYVATLVVLLLRVQPVITVDSGMRQALILALPAFNIR